MGIDWRHSWGLDISKLFWVEQGATRLTQVSLAQRLSLNMPNKLTTMFSKILKFEENLKLRLLNYHRLNM